MREWRYERFGIGIAVLSRPYFVTKFRIALLRWQSYVMKLGIAVLPWQLPDVFTEFEIYLQFYLAFVIVVRDLSYLGPSRGAVCDAAVIYWSPEIWGFISGDSYWVALHHLSSVVQLGWVLVASRGQSTKWYGLGKTFDNNGTWRRSVTADRLICVLGLCQPVTAQRVIYVAVRARDNKVRPICAPACVISLFFTRQNHAAPRKHLACVWQQPDDQKCSTGVFV